MTQTKNQSLRVKEGRTLLTTDHNGEELTFAHPHYGPGTYAQVGEQIQKEGLARPTMAQTVSLVHTAFNSDDKYSKEIKDIMRNKWLWAYTGILYVPNKGAYIQDDPQIKNAMPYMDQNELERKLYSNDPTVRFVPFGYKTGEMTPIQMAKNPFVIVQAGQEGAQKLSEVADKFKRKPYLYSFDSVVKPITRVSALNSDWDFGSRLNVSGDLHGDDDDGCAFGVLDKTGEASRQKNNTHHY